MFDEKDDTELVHHHENVLNSTEILQVDKGEHNHSDPYRDGRHVENNTFHLGDISVSGQIKGDRQVSIGAKVNIQVQEHSSKQDSTKVKESHTALQDVKDVDSSDKDEACDKAFCPPTAVKCKFKGEGTGGVLGEITITQGEDELNPNQAHFKGQISGLTPGLHGFHVHAKGDLGDNCKAAGGHFNPEGGNHGSKEAMERHVGDLGNLEAGEDGNIQVDMWDHLAVLRGDNSIIGKAIVVHEGRDDEGEGGDEGSLKHGNAGARAG